MPCSRPASWCLLPSVSPVSTHICMSVPVTGGPHLGLKASGLGSGFTVLDKPGKGWEMARVVATPRQGLGLGRCGGSPDPATHSVRMPTSGGPSGSQPGTLSSRGWASPLCQSCGWCCPGAGATQAWKVPYGVCDAALWSVHISHPVSPRPTLPLGLPRFRVT